MFKNLSVFFAYFSIFLVLFLFQYNKDHPNALFIDIGWSYITYFHIIQFLIDELYLINIIFAYSKVPEKYNKGGCNLCHNLNHAIILHETIHKDYV